MARAVGQAQAIVKTAYVRSERLLDLFRALPCQCCGAPPRSDPAHSNWHEHGKGGAIKASDVYVAAMCRRCHQMIDQGSKLSGDERKRIWTNAWILSVRLITDAGNWPDNVAHPDLPELELIE